MVGVVNRQPNSDGVRIERPPRAGGQSSLEGTGLTRYDVLLATIPVLLVVAWLVGQVFDVPLWTAMAVGAFAALPLVADGLAVNPPR